MMETIPEQTHMDTKNSIDSLPQPTAPPQPTTPPPRYSPTITNQPAAQEGGPRANWTGASQPLMQPMPASRGLQYLQTAPQLYIQQHKDMSEMCGCEVPNTFVISNSQGQQVFSAQEDTDECMAQCCGAYRSFELNVVDNDHKIAMVFKRGQIHVMEIEAPAGHFVGSVERKTFLVPSFDVKNANRQNVLRIEGPVYTGNLGGNVDFKILSLDGSTQIGNIRKKWSGLANEMFTDADNFEIVFPPNADVAMKAVLLGGLFLIDMLYYENNQN